MSSEWVYSLPDISAGFSIQQTLSQQAQLQSLKPFQFYVQYWDSFDERLNRAGIRLWTEEQHDRQFKLFFQDAYGFISSLSPSQALFRADDFPSMEIRRKLRPLLEPRALLPHLRIQRKRTPWIRKNMEGKKVLSLAAGAGSGLLPADPFSWRRGNRDKTRIDSSPASGRPGILQSPGGV